MMIFSNKTNPPFSGMLLMLATTPNIEQMSYIVKWIAFEFTNFWMLD